MQAPSTHVASSVNSRAAYGRPCFQEMFTFMSIDHAIGLQGGVVAGLGSAGVMFGAVGAASDLMQDFRTGYLTLASAKVYLTSVTDLLLLLQ